MPSYKLKDKCLFVDAFVYDEPNKKPKMKAKPKNPPTTGTIVLAHVMDKSTPDNKYVMMNDAAAFIARFIVMGVKTEDIPQLLKSEYQDNVTNFSKEVEDVYKHDEGLSGKARPGDHRIYSDPEEEGGGTTRVPMS